jgi:hypothetical protein
MGRVVDADFGRTGDEGEGERDATREVVDGDEDDESSGRGKKNLRGFQ